MTYHITHRTRYEYEAAVSASQHVARLEPRVTSTQTREDFSLEISPLPALRKSRLDYFGNELCFFAIQEMHQQLEIVSTGRVAVRLSEKQPLDDSPQWENIAAMFCDAVSPSVVEPYQFVFESPHIPTAMKMADYALESFARKTPLLAGTRDLTRRIFEDFKYDPAATMVATPLDEVWEHRQGVCQDFAHLAIACLRSLGLPARYVSGYLRTGPPAGKERLVGADASHAWFSVYSPGAGWVDFDPTNNVQPSGEHITLAYGRDFSDVSPVAGILTGGGQHRVKVAVDVVDA